MSRPMVMIDIETLGKLPGCGILSIAAVEFDEFGYCRSELHIHVAPNGQVDMDTVLWWMKQSEEARTKAFFPAVQVSLQNALEQLGAWVKGMDKSPIAEVWSKSPTFDLAILRDAFIRETGGEAPWRYWQERDVRTELRNMPRDQQSAAHDALDDCKAQIKALATKWSRDRDVMDAARKFMDSTEGKAIVEFACGEG